MCLTILWNCQKLLRVEVVPAKEKTRNEEPEGPQALLEGPQALLECLQGGGQSRALIQGTSLLHRKENRISVTPSPSKFLANLDEARFPSRPSTTIQV